MTAIRWGSCVKRCKKSPGKTWKSLSWIKVTPEKTPPRPLRAEAAQEQGIELLVVKLPEAKKGFVLLPKRWVVERSFGWMTRFRRLAEDYERLPETVRGLHFLAFACLMFGRVFDIIQSA